MTFQNGGVTFTRHKSQALAKPGRGSVGISVANHEDLSPWKPSASDPWDAEKVKHLFRRAGFGASPQELAGALAIGSDRTLDFLLTMPTWTIPTQGTFFLPDTGEIVNMSSTTGQMAGWLWMMNNSPYVLREKLALFYADHFSMGVAKVRYPNLMGDTINLYRRHSMGSFRAMLKAITLEPAMLLFLDNYLNRRGRPNENYAREIFELYAIDVGGGYTEKDIQEAARALTGFTTALGTSFFNARFHDTGVKNVLGRRLANGSNGKQDLEDLLDAILAWPATAKFLPRKMWEYFVYPNPSQALVDKLAAKWVTDGFSLQALVETIFRSKAFFSQQARGVLVKNPVEYMMGMLKNLGIKKVHYGRVNLRLAALYQPLNYDNPSGLPDGRAWINSLALIQRTNFGMDVIRNVNSFIRFVFRGLAYLPALDVAAIIKQKNLSTPTKIVDHFLDVMLEGKVPPLVRMNLIFYMTTLDTQIITWNEARWAQPKGTGLIHLIAALPEYHIN